ncbi:microtubule integrity protein mal3 [Sorochytrium milnesiophthora]
MERRRSESRVELLAWINSLLQLNYTKIEQLGTGAAYCQVVDSVYGDVQMSKVKFDAKLEYEYVANYKVLQLAFDKHRISQAIPVERLMKCKFQDNIEFCQWMKKFHDTFFPGGHYDAPGRRKGGVGAAARPMKPSLSGHNLASSARSTLSSTRTGAAAAAPVSSAMRRSSSTVSSSPGGTGPGASSAALSAAQRQVAELTQQLNEQVAVAEGLEKERDFYFGKLRDIEVLIQQSNEQGEKSALGQLITQILYSTEEGFEVPAEEQMDQDAPLEDTETF